MKLIRPDSNTAKFAFSMPKIPFRMPWNPRAVAVGANKVNAVSQTGQKAAQVAGVAPKKGLVGKTFDVMNALMVPTMAAPLFLKSSDTRAQEQMLEEIKKNPRLGVPFKVPGMNPEGLQDGKIIGNPTPNVMQPGSLPPGSLR